MIWPFLVVVALLAGLAVASVDILSDVRAYVGGESLWSKGEKDAVDYLGRYIESHEPEDFRRFQGALAVPLGDRVGRLSLDQTPPDLAAARRGFLAGGNHADDVDGMIQLYLRFRHVSFMADAIAIWAEADEQIGELGQLGHQIHDRIHAGDVDSMELRALVARLPPLNEQLTSLGQRFSATLGEASRTARRLVLVITFLLAAGLTTGGVAVTAYMLKLQAGAERALREGNDRWSLAADAAGIGLFDWDLERDRVSLDARAALLYGLPAVPTQVAATYLSADTVHPEDAARLRSAVKQAMAEPAPLALRYRVLRAGGKVAHIQVLAHVRGRANDSEAEADGGAARMVGIVRDVSDEMQAAQLHLDKEAAERANRARGEFLSRVSHELRTPLNAVLGFTELMQTDPVDVLTAGQSQRVQRVLDAGRHLLELINDILDLSSIDEGALALQVRALPLAPVLQASLNQIEPMAQAKHVVLHLSAPGPAFSVHADALRLEQVFVNLLSNAVKYNRSGGQVQVTCAREGDEAVITVSDTGLGLRPAQIEQLFQPFNRLGAEFSKVEGSGLGLVISQQLVKRMDGSLTLSSTEGVGTSVAVRLKMAET